MSDAVVYLDFDDIVECNKDVIAEYGDGLFAVIYPALIDSAVGSIRNGYYETFAEVAVQYLSAIALNHAFEAGNKRTGTLAMTTFLEANDIDVSLTTEWVFFIIEHVKGTVSKESLIERLRRIIIDRPLP